MKKIKISELPLYQSLKGLFVMGTDVNNRSVKVNLEFIETETTNAVKASQEATVAAGKAKELADSAATTASRAAQEATKATSTATTAANKASDAADTAINASGQAQAAANKANAASQAAQEAKRYADEATEAAQEAAEKAQEATTAAEKATEKVLETLGIIVPTGLEVECLSRLTSVNVEPVYIKTTLTPETAMKNLIFISDNKSVEVGLDGRLTIVGKGRSRIYVIPTCNTALAKTLLIEVGEPTLRLASHSALRLTQAGAFRLN